MKTWLVATLIFCFALLLRIWNLDQAGRWWDENWYVTKGYTFLEFVKHGNFSDPFWYKGGADHPPFSTYIYGAAAYLDFVRFDPTLQPFKDWPKGVPVFRYDLHYARLVSVFISSLTAVLVFLIGQRYFSRFIGIAAATIFSMLPHFLGFSQFVSLESWITCTFTLAVFLFWRYLETSQKKYLFWTGVSAGCCVMTKESDVLIFPLLVTTAGVWWWLEKKAARPIGWSLVLALFTLCGVAGVTAILIWPMPFAFFHEYSEFLHSLWLSGGRIPELIFGIRMGARAFFYGVAYLVTTPVLILLLNWIGFGESWQKRRDWRYIALCIWFCAPFLLSFFHHRQNMVRYIIQFYVPLALLAAIGIERVIRSLPYKLQTQTIALALVLFYLFANLYRVTPYYLTYFNEFVGHTRGVYEHQLFFIGWHGEGLGRPGKYVAQVAEPGAKIGLALNPPHTVYRDDRLNYEIFDPTHQYDYIITNYFNTIRLGFDEKILEKDYTIVYREQTDGVDLARVYKRKYRIY